MSRIKNSWFGYLFLIASFVMLLSLYIRFSAYPYYFQFDTDATVAIDTLLINSNKLPDHVQHPSYGMYVFFSLATEAGKHSGLLAISNMSDLGQCINKPTCMAEFTQYLRTFSPFVAASVACMLVLVFSALLKNDRAHLMLMTPIMALFFLEETLRYNSIIIKSEIYSAFFWAAAVLITAVSSEWSKRKYAVALILSGFLIGLCFTTKTQYAFYAASLYIFSFLLVALKYEAEDEKKRVYSLRGMLIANAVTVVLLLYAFYQASTFSFDIGFSNVSPNRIPKKVGEINFFGYLLCAYIIGIFSINVFMIVRNRKPGIVANVLLNTTFLNTGVVGSFYVALFLCGYVDKPLDLMSQALRMIFFRDASSFSPMPSGYLSYISEFVSSRRGIYICSAVIGIGGVVISTISATKQRAGNAKTAVVALLLLLLFLVVGNFYFAVRPILRDLFVAKILILFFVVVAVKVTIDLQRGEQSGVIRKICVASLWALLILNAPYYFKIEKEISAENTHYGWNEYRWLIGVYDVNHRLYGKLMEESVATPPEIAVDGQGWNYSRIAARRLANNKEILRSIFINQEVNAGRIGYVYNHFPVFAFGKGETIKKVPSFLYGGLIYSNADIPAMKGGLLPGEFYEIPGYRIYAFDKKRPILNALGVLPRNDYKIRIYLQRGVWGKEYLYIHQSEALPGQEIELDNGDIYDCFAITTYRELNKSEMGERFFFVIVEN